MTKSDILSFVNSRLRRHETDIDEELRLVLDDLADLLVLRGYDDTQGLTATSLYLDYPSDCLDVQGAIISVCVDAESDEGSPLPTLRGGWREYRRLCSGNVNALRSTPAAKLAFGGKIYLYPPPGGNYTTRIWYYRRHAEALEPIEFPAEWDRCIKFGVTAEVAAKYGLNNYQAWQVWNTRYLGQKQERALSLPHDPAIVETSL